MTHAGDSEAREFADAFRSFLEWIYSAPGTRNEVVELVADFLGENAAGLSVVTRSLPAFEQVNLQTALNAWSAEPGREVAVHGFSIPPHHPPVTLQQLLTGEGLPALRLSAPALADLPNGPGSTLACLEIALLLVEDADGRYVVMVRAWSEHGPPSLDLEIAGLPVDAAQAVHARVAELRHQLNVYRGHLIDVGLNQMGQVTLDFGQIPKLVRSDVVLPEAVLGRIERHALGIAAHREVLLGAGQHLKRGLLLCGPPGTGKTHTMRYLVGQWPRTPGSCSPDARCTRSARWPSSHATFSRRSSSSRTSTWSPSTEASGHVARALSYSTCSTRWTALPPTPTFCSCSRPIGPTCSSRRSPRAPGASTWRSRSTCRTKRAVSDSGRET